MCKYRPTCLRARRLLAAVLAGGSCSSLSAAAVSCTVSTLAGNGSAGFADGAGSAATFRSPMGLALVPGGAIAVADEYNNAIRLVSPVGGGWRVTTLAGNGSLGETDGAASVATFALPIGLAVDASGVLYVGDYGGTRIRRVADGFVTTLAGSGVAGAADGAATAATFSSPAGVAVDAAGGVAVADAGNGCVRYIETAAGGGGGGGGGRGGEGATVSTMAPPPAGAAPFSLPLGLVTVGGSAGAPISFIVAGYNDQLVRMISLDAGVLPLAGNGSAGYADGCGSAAMFNFPSAVALDKAGNVYIADALNNRLRRVSLGGCVVTLAGGGGGGGGSFFDQPGGVLVLSDEAAATTLVVADSNANTLRLVVCSPGTAPAPPVQLSAGAAAGIALAALVLAAAVAAAAMQPTAAAAVCAAPFRCVRGARLAQLISKRGGGGSLSRGGRVIRTASDANDAIAKSPAWLADGGGAEEGAAAAPGSSGVAHGHLTS